MRTELIRRRRAFLLMDSVFGLVLITVLLTTLIIAVAQQRKGERVLSQRREAYRHAEAAADALAAGQPVPPDVRVEWLADPAAVPGHAWARLTAGQASLITLAPHAPGGAP